MPGWIGFLFVVGCLGTTLEHELHFLGIEKGTHEPSSNLARFDPLPDGTEPSLHESRDRKVSRSTTSTFRAGAWARALHIAVQDPASGIHGDPRVGELLEAWRKQTFDAWFMYLVCLVLATVAYHYLRQYVSPVPPASDEHSKDSKANRLTRQLTFIETGADTEGRVLTQSGCRSWLFGTLIWLGWVLVPTLGLLQSVALIIDEYFFVGYALTDKEFIFVFAITMSTMLVSVALRGALEGWFMMPCELEVAECVVIQEEDEALQHSTHYLGSQYHEFQKASRTSIVPVDSATDQRYFEYTCLRYTWLPDLGKFTPTGTVTVSGAQAQNDFSRGGLSLPEVQKRRQQVGENKIAVYVPGIIASLAEEFASIIFVFQLGSVLLYFYLATPNIGFMWLLFAFCAGAFKALFIIRTNRSKIADMALSGCNELEHVLRDGKWITVEATELVPGDIIRVRTGMATADIVLFAGGAVVNESMLTGEPMPVFKAAVDKNTQFEVTPQKHGKKHFVFAGTKVLESIGDPSNETAASGLGVVISVGARTNKGTVVRMVLFPTDVQAKYMEELPYVFAIMAVWSLILWFNIHMFQGRGWVLAAFTGLCTFLQSVNPMMPVSLTLGQSVAARRLDQSDIVCLSLGRLPLAAKLRTMVFDKTGTITHDGMDFLAAKPIIAREFRGQVTAGELQKSYQGTPVANAVAACHSVQLLSDGTLVGTHVEAAMVEASGWKLPSAKEARIIRHPSGDTIRVLRMIDFDFNRMTSGAVVQTPGSKPMVLIKGAFDRVQQLCAATSVPLDFCKVCEDYGGVQCCYVLAVAYKELSDTIDVSSLSRDELETELELCGLLLFRNEVKEDSKEAILEIREGGVNCVMCTGDNVLTGVNVARRCGILEQDADLLIGDVHDQGLRWKTLEGADVDLGRSLEHTQLAVTKRAFDVLRQDYGSLEQILPMIKVFARMVPSDKVEVVQLWQQYKGLGLVVGMTGDGGNDCAALRAAHVGVALSEAEASMVSPFSSRQGLQDKGYMSLKAVGNVLREGRACLATNMATYSTFMVYCCLFSFTKSFLVSYADTLFSEWGYICGDIIFGLFMVYFMTWSRPADKLASITPTGSLFMYRVVMTVTLMVMTYLAATLVLVWMLNYGPGVEFYDYVHSTWLEMSAEDWTKKGDNHMATNLYILLITCTTTASLLFTRGHAFRQPLWKNVPLCVTYTAFVAFSVACLWAPPNPYTCVFRINCDTKNSLKSNLPIISAVSVSSLGGCYLGPQQVRCRREDHRCYMWAPPDAPFPTREGAPFENHEEKLAYCSRPGADEEACFSPDVASGCEPGWPDIPADREYPDLVKTGCGPVSSCGTKRFNTIFSCLILAVVTAFFLLHRFIYMAETWPGDEEQQHSDISVELRTAKELPTGNGF